MVGGERMIDRPPEYNMACHCGMKISGTNEKGLVSLLKKHFESGEYHLAYLSVQKDSTTKSESEKLVDIAISLREKTNASTKRKDNHY
jgi:hypothetical protein